MIGCLEGAQTAEVLGVVFKFKVALAPLRGDSPAEFAPPGAEK
jgi:hypothetical protein